jgi:hypothetical protein
MLSKIRARVGQVGLALGGGSFSQSWAISSSMPCPVLGRDEDRVLGGEAEHLFDFLRDLVRSGAGQVDLV